MKDEFESFPERDQPAKEPLEPFVDESLPESEQKTFQLKTPTEPLNSKKMHDFLLSLEKLLLNHKDLSHIDFLVLVKNLQDIKNLLHHSDLGEHCLKEFEGLISHFNALLIRSASLNREVVLNQIHAVQKTLQ